MEDEFYRLKRLPPYVFAEVNAMKAKARADGRDIIDFGMGNPDSPTPDHIVEKLAETARNPRSPTRGGRVLRPPLRCRHRP
jgi:alanine-synthesizing transaminase